MGKDSGQYLLVRFFHKYRAKGKTTITPEEQLMEMQPSSHNKP
jgi:hypothetical protein